MSFASFGRGGEFDVAERSLPPRRHFTELAVLLVPDGQIKERARHESMTLVVPRIREFIAERIGVVAVCRVRN